MYCPKCGKENADDSRFCVSCGTPFTDSGHQARSESFDDVNRTIPNRGFMDFSEEKRVNKNFAIASLLLGVANIVIVLVGMFISGRTLLTGQILGSTAVFFGTLVLSVIVGILVMVFQTLVIYQWSQSLNGNIKNTQNMLLNLLNTKSDNRVIADIHTMTTEMQNLRLEPWAFWVYLGLYFIALFVPSPGDFWVNILGFVFLAVYLQMVFTLSKKLQDIKARFYSFYGRGSMSNLHRIKSRNIGIFILLTIVTFGIYWWYLLIVMSGEINDFLDIDQQARKNL